jgi:chromatin remodeling complex protein RSC6
MMLKTESFRSRGKNADFLSAMALQSVQLCALSTDRNNRRAMMAEGSRKAGGGLARPVTPSADLAQICGSQPLPRSQVVSKVWDHIRKNNLQNPQNKREILADDKLKKVFGGKDRVSMFEMNKHLSNHLK